MIDGVGGGENGGASGSEGKPDETGAGENELGFFVGRDADDASTASQGSGDVEIAGDVGGDSLGTAEAAKVDRRAAIGVDAMDAVVAGGGGAGDVESAIRTEGHVIGGDAGFESREDESLRIARDLEDGAAAIADVEIAAGVEGDGGGDSHAFCINGSGAFWRDAMNGALVAGGDVQITVGVERKSGSVDQAGEKDAHFAVGANFEDRDGCLLTALAGEGDEDVARVVDGGIGDGVDILSEQPGNVDVDRIAAAAVAENFETRRADVDFRDTDDKSVTAAEQDRGGGATDDGKWSLQSTRDGNGAEVCAVDFDLAAGEGGVREHGLDTGTSRAFRFKNSHHKNMPAFTVPRSMRSLMVRNLMGWYPRFR